jgi:phosphoglycolate phosphatase
MAKLILFDIDGTLVLTGGAGSRAMTSAFREVFGIDDAFARVAMPGRTDDVIVAEALALASLQSDPARVRAFRERYAADLTREIQAPHPGKRVMPGVFALLRVLHARPDVVLALLTGNYTETARIKLEHFDLWRYFRCGAYGGDAAGRDALVPVALSRAREIGSPVRSPRDVIVVGDTPLDVRCARSANAVSFAVATGGYDAETLRKAGADAVFEDLSDTAAFMSALDGEWETSAPS